MLQVFWKKKKSNGMGHGDLSSFKVFRKRQSEAKNNK